LWPLVDAQTALREFAGLDGPVLVCGSLYLLAEILRLRPGLLEGRENQKQHKIYEYILCCGRLRPGLPEGEGEPEMKQTR
jgi:hypothetical protein